MLDFDALPRAGRHFVYFLCARKAGHDPAEAIVYVYVGVTSDLRSRMRAHSRRWWWPGIDHDLTAFVEFPTRAEANTAERDAIELHQPEMNRAGRLRLVPTA